MKSQLRHYAAATALLALAGLLITSCAARLWPQAAPGERTAGAASEMARARVERPLAKRPPGPAGELAVEIPWPQYRPTDRGIQFTYGGGSAVAALEIFLTDSLNNYQSKVVLRNTALPQGLTAGTAKVLFSHVPEGRVVLSVHTTTRNLLGDLVIADSSNDTQYWSITNPSTGASVSVAAKAGTQKTEQFLVFDSADLLGAAAANGAPSIYLTTARVYDTGSRTNANEITDGAFDARAGYGIGAATETIVASQTKTVTLKVTQAPTFAFDTYHKTGDSVSAATFSAGDAMSLKATGVVAGDQILATDSALHTGATTEVVDLAKNLGYVIPIATSDSTTIRFSTTKAFAAATSSVPFPALHTYFLRGSLISLIHTTRRDPPRMAVLPNLIDATGSSLQNTGSTLAPTKTEDVFLTLKDRFGNPISDLGTLAGSNSALVIDRNVTPLVFATKLLVPAKTYGSISAFAAVNTVTKPGIWKATYTQGANTAISVADTAVAATVSFDTVKAITGLTEYLLPFARADQKKVVVEVLEEGANGIRVDIYAVKTATATPRLATKLFDKTQVDLTVASSSLPIQTRYTLVTGAALDKNANGSTVNDITAKTLGNRREGDTDLLAVTISSASQDFAGNATYKWAK